MNCPHQNFLVNARVNRLTKQEGGEAYDFNVEIQICCAECQEPFHFKGPFEAGLSHRHVTVSNDRLELRCPIAPGEGEFIARSHYEMPDETE